MKIRVASIFSVILGVCVLISGCKDVPTIWRQEVQSPDGSWLAIAHTEQNGGFGSASITTGVDLKRIDGTVHSGRPVDILELWSNGPSPKRPYVLDNDANAGGMVNLTMKWLDPSHLEVTYDGQARVDFQVVKLAGIDISLQDLSKKAASQSPQ
jgi:hypothetical protein